MIDLIFTFFFGTIFVFTGMLLTIGMMFLLRVLISVWFDVDFMDIVMDWIKGNDDGKKNVL